MVLGVVAVCRRERDRASVGVADVTLVPSFWTRTAPPSINDRSGLACAGSIGTGAAISQAGTLVVVVVVAELVVADCRLSRDGRVLVSAVKSMIRDGTATRLAEWGTRTRDADEGIGTGLMAVSTRRGFRSEENLPIGVNKRSLLPRELLGAA